MSSEKYIGLDVHQATISVAVMDSQGKFIMESILETKASTIECINPLDFTASTEEPAPDHYCGETFSGLFAQQNRTRLDKLGQFDRCR